MPVFLSKHFYQAKTSWNVMTSSLHASKDSLELNHDQIMCHDENCCTENVVDDARGMNPTCHESATVFVQTFFSSQN